MGGALIETEARAILKETALRMIKAGKLTVKEIAEYSGLDVAEVQKLKSIEGLNQQVQR